jgi:hypothetical protein
MVGKKPGAIHNYPPHCVDTLFGELLEFKEMNCCHEPVKGKVPSSTP